MPYHHFDATAEGGASSEALLEAALGIARGGGRPLPCAYGSKSPFPSTA